MQQKSEGERTRLEDMLIGFALNNKSNPSNLIEIAKNSSSNHKVLSSTWEKNARKCLNWMLDTIIPINSQDSSVDPDFMIHIKEFSNRNISPNIRGMELPVKVLSLKENADIFRNSRSYVNSKGLMIVISMDNDIPANAFMAKFFNELSRIETALETD